MRRSATPILALAAGGVLLLAGCQSTRSTSPAPSGENDAARLVAHTWVIEDLAGGGIIDRSRVTVQFFPDDGRVAGAASCNRYTAGYTLTDSGLSIGQAAATRMACAPALMDQEQKFLRILAAVEAFQIDATGALILSGPAGTMKGYPE